MEPQQSETSPRVLYGIPASPGIVVGRVVLVDGAGRSRRRAWRPVADVDEERRRFRAAVELAEQELTELRSRFGPELEESAAILDSHILMLRDGMLYDRTLAIIGEQGVNAEWALDKALEHTASLFERISDPYIRARFEDVEHVAGRVLRILEGGEEEPWEGADEEPVILAARDFSPEDTLRMRSDRILGFLTEMGGATSHTAIVARSLGIPSVVGVEGITGQVASGTLVVLDGNAGRIHLNPTETQLEQFREQQRQFRQYSEQVALFAHLPAVTIDGVRIKVEANIEMVDELASALEYGAGGVGLFRSEYQYISSAHLPGEEELFAVYQELAISAAPFPVTIRTLDIGGDKFASSVRWGGETNPAMGLRAIRFSLRETPIFKTQLRAIFRAGLHGNLRVMFPMISSRCELDRIKEIVAEVLEELKRQGVAHAPDIAQGIMVEVPSAVTISDSLAREVDFFSIGTNDLIQYALAIDRVNEYVAHMYEPLHPAVLRMIRQVVEAGHEAGIEVGLCGEMAGDVICLPLLLGLGVDELSMHPLAIPYVKRMIRQSTAAEAAALAQEILFYASSKQIREHLSRYLPERYPEEFGATGLGRLKATRSC